MRYILAWFALLLLFALPAAATTTTCWDAVDGNPRGDTLAGPVTRYQRNVSGVIAYEGWFYPANNAADELLWHKTVFPNDGGLSLSFVVFAAIPTATETGKNICMQLVPIVQPFPPLAVLDFGIPTIITSGLTTVSAIANAVSFPANQTMTFSFGSITPRYQLTYEGVTSAACDHLHCDLQPMWLAISRIGTLNYQSTCNPDPSTQSVVDGVVTTIICMSR